MDRRRLVTIVLGASLVLLPTASSAVGLQPAGGPRAEASFSPAPPGSRTVGSVPAGPTHGGALALSNASAQVVQAQPPAGSCHAIGSGLYVEPDPHCTPGALNPQVTQATVGQTICSSGWTKTVRPSESVTEAEKRASLAAYGDTGPLHGFEYDHLVSLELGGAPNDARNLWPEPGASPNPKDTVEDALHRQVCDGSITLAAAQRIIAEQWVPYYRSHY